MLLCLGDTKHPTANLERNKASIKSENANCKWKLKTKVDTESTQFITKFMTDYYNTDCVFQSFARIITERLDNINNKKWNEQLTQGRD